MALVIKARVDLFDPQMRQLLTGQPGRWCGSSGPSPARCAPAPC